MDFGTIRTAASAVAVLALLVGCADVRPGPAGAPVMGVRSFLDIRHMCSLGVSPPIALDDAPGPGRYKVRMTNTSVAYAPSADFDVVADGSEIPEGALQGYRGICPGETQNFSIRVEVVALDAQGRTAAYGYTHVSATSTTRLMRLGPNDRTTMPRRLK
jgi:hypothetical protein